MPSLVGSEMCIRDSLSPVYPIRAHPAEANIYRGYAGRRYSQRATGTRIENNNAAALEAADDYPGPVVTARLHRLYAKSSHAAGFIAVGHAITPDLLAGEIPPRELVGGFPRLEGLYLGLTERVGDKGSFVGSYEGYIWTDAAHSGHVRVGWPQGGRSSPPRARARLSLGKARGYGWVGERFFFGGGRKRC